MTADTRVIVVVAQTKLQAHLIAVDLGLDPSSDDIRTFGAWSADYFEGLRPKLVLIDANATIARDLMQVIYGAVLLVGGRIRRVTVETLDV